MYRVSWAILGAFIPIIILSICNTRLIIEVGRSKARYSAHRGKYTTSRITIILITIIILHVALVCPSIIVSFLVETISNKQDLPQFYQYLTAMVITNVMQTLNFAINFILYCIISKTFRENLKGSTCNLARTHSTQKTTPRTSSEEAKHRYQMVAMTTANQTPSTRTTTTQSSKTNGNCSL